jgi:hypothetical protein
MSKRTIRILMLLATACAALLVMTATGSARGNSDRNRDRIPDRWERAHHLSLKVNQARRDQDHDGLRNRAEFLAGTDPRNNDSDDDGTNDGGEGAGTVTSFTGGVLIVHLFNGDDVKGTVDDQTEIECKTRPTGQPTVVPTARKADEGPGGAGQGDDGEGEHNQQGQQGQQGDDGDDENGQDDDGDEDGNQPGCDATALTTGAVVGEAELKTTAAGLVFTKIEIVG